MRLFQGTLAASVEIVGKNCQYEADWKGRRGIPTDAYREDGRSLLRV